MNNNLIEGKDFYYDEQGFFVFTEKYHLERGYCCGNGCRHCPYTAPKSSSTENGFEQTDNL